MLLHTRPLAEAAKISFLVLAARCRVEERKGSWLLRTRNKFMVLRVLLVLIVYGL